MATQDVRVLLIDNSYNPYYYNKNKNKIIIKYIGTILQNIPCPWLVLIMTVVRDGHGVLLSGNIEKSKLRVTKSKLWEAKLNSELPSRNSMLQSQNYKNIFI